MFVCELEGLNQPQGFVDISANGEVIHGDLTEDTLAINDKKATEGHSIIFLVNLISLKKEVTISITAKFLVLMYYSGPEESTMIH